MYISVNGVGKKMFIPKFKLIQEKIFIHKGQMFIERPGNVYGLIDSQALMPTYPECDLPFDGSQYKYFSASKLKTE